MAVHYLIRFVQQELERIAERPELRFLLDEWVRIPQVNTKTHSAGDLAPMLEYFRMHGYPRTRVGPRGLVLRVK